MDRRYFVEINNYYLRLIYFYRTQAANCRERGEIAAANRWRQSSSDLELKLDRHRDKYYYERKKSPALLTSR